MDVGPLFQTPAEAAQQAVDADVHIIGEQFFSYKSLEMPINDKADYIIFLESYILLHNFAFMKFNSIEFSHHNQLVENEYKGVYNFLQERALSQPAI